MIIVGDIASPSKAHTEKLKEFFKRNKEIFLDQKLICNFEGLISEQARGRDDTPILYNHPSVLPVLKDVNLVVACLANNHTLDLPECFNETRESFSHFEIKGIGAATSKNEAILPITYIEDGIEVVVFNYCWNFLLYHQRNPSNGVFIAELDELLLLDTVRKLKNKNPEVQIVVNVHWSFDLETLPFPSYRQFGKLLLDAGASIIAGCHSHCVQGGEKFGEGYILYGLGNFFMPHNVFAGGQIIYPEISKMQLAFEYNLRTKKAKCHWVEYNGNQDTLISYIKTEDFENSDILKQYTPFAGMGNKEYVAYYKQNRRKNFLIPVYKDVNAVKMNDVFTRWLIIRARVLRMLAKYKLRSWQN